jgi:hypothetical protein
MRGRRVFVAMNILTFCLIVALDYLLLTCTQVNLRMMALALTLFTTRLDELIVGRVTLLVLALVLSSVDRH